jgi:hypothetical protein
MKPARVDLLATNVGYNVVSRWRVALPIGH